MITRDIFSNYETPLWTLIGVAMGFILSYFYSWIIGRKQYKVRTQEIIERIKKVMHLSNSQQAIQRLADLIPQFKEREQIKILSEIGMESSLNSNTDEVTQCVIEELQWICILYEIDLNNIHKLLKKSKKDNKKIKTIQSALADILINIIEYRQSEKLLDRALYLLGILDSYSIKQGYLRTIASSIELYKNVGRLSVGIEYAEDGYKVLNFQFGINESTKRLHSLRDSLYQSSLQKSKIAMFLEAIDNAMQVIKKEFSEKILS